MRCTTCNARSLRIIPTHGRPRPIRGSSPRRPSRSRPSWQHGQGRIDRWIHHGRIGHSGANKGCGPDACSPSKLPALVCPLCLPGESMVSVTPLSGIVVIEIGHSIAAPYAGMILGELGAEVIKVENPKGGDAARGWGPPFQEGASTCFHSVNRAKLGVTIDLADPADAARLRALILERADVVIHNLKYGALDKFGLAPAALIAEKPQLVCCNLAAFGNTGPLRDRPGYDPMMQAYSGLMSLLGEDGRPPVRVTASIIDMGAAMWAVIGILAARPRAEWAKLLEAAGIPNGPINTLDQVVADAQTQALGIIQKRPDSELELVGLPLSFDGRRPPFTKAAPALGEDNDAVLG